VQHILIALVDDDRRSQRQGCARCRLQNVQARRLHRPEIYVDFKAIRERGQLFHAEMARQQKDTPRNSETRLARNTYRRNDEGSPGGIV